MLMRLITRYCLVFLMFQSVSKAQVCTFTASTSNIQIDVEVSEGNDSCEGSDEGKLIVRAQQGSKGISGQCNFEFKGDEESASCSLKACESNEPRNLIVKLTDVDSDSELLFRITTGGVEIECTEGECIQECDDLSFFLIKPGLEYEFTLPDDVLTPPPADDEPTVSPILLPTSSPILLPISAPSQNQNADDDSGDIFFLIIGTILGTFSVILIFFGVRKKYKRGSARKEEKYVFSTNATEDVKENVLPPPIGSHLTLTSVGSEVKHFTLNSTQAREDARLKFLRFSSVSQQSQLSHLLRNNFSKRDSTTFVRLSNATGITASTVETYKRTMNSQMQERERKFKAVSSRLSSNYSRINELLGMADGIARVEKPNWSKSARELVKQVSDRLQGDILSAAEVEELENTDLQGPLANFSGEVPPVDLEFYLFRLVTALNRWFDPDGNSEIVGMRSLIFAIIYLRKIKQTVPLFGLTDFNVHRIFGILLLVAAKFTEDELISNAFWADACGLTMGEVNKLEEDFCFSSEFNFFVTPTELHDMAAEFGLNIAREPVHRINVASN